MADRRSSELTCSGVNASQVFYGCAVVAFSFFANNTKRRIARRAPTTIIDPAHEKKIAISETQIKMASLIIDHSVPGQDKLIIANAKQTSATERVVETLICVLGGVASVAI
jgi:hypothetical protein